MLHKTHSVFNLIVIKFAFQKCRIPSRRLQLLPKSLAAMTINHLFVYVSYARFAAMRKFYNSALRPLGYTEMMHPRDDLVAFGSDFPYFWLKRMEEGRNAVATHVAFDAPSKWSSET